MRARRGAGTWQCGQGAICAVGPGHVAALARVLLPLLLAVLTSGRVPTYAPTGAGESASSGQTSCARVRCAVGRVCDGGGCKCVGGVPVC